MSLSCPKLEATSLALSQGEGGRFELGTADLRISSRTFLLRTISLADRFQNLPRVGPRDRTRPGVVSDASRPVEVAAGSRASSPGRVSRSASCLSGR